MSVSPVLVIGSGLLGASLGLRLRELGSEVYIEDASPSAKALARDLGAGQIAGEGMPDPALVVVAVPPDVTAHVVVRALERFPDAIVTDVASVKELVVREVEQHPGAAQRYLGSHPMAGRERSGAIAADADLFAGRPWVLTPTEATPQDVVTALQQLALDVGSLPVIMAPEEHDRSVALVSHMPQLMSSLVAGALRSAPVEALGLAGQGLRDVTRIARSDSALWATIVAANARAIGKILSGIRGELDRLLAALEPGAKDPFEPGVLAGVARAVQRGNEGVERIPGKHGGAPRRYSEVIALIPDEPGALGRLFALVGEAGINIEDLQIEHSAGQPVGRAALHVQPTQAWPLVVALERHGYQVIFEGRNPSMGLVIAIDGPSGSGKSTVSKQVARELRLGYLDTGAMYRCATWWCMHEDIDLDDAEAVTAAVRQMPLEMPLDPDNQVIMCAGEDITAAIRTPELTKVVSKVATNLDVRAELVRRQKEIIAGARGGIIAEGRDITTVVAPDAHVRALITASEEARLARRSLEVRGSADAAAVEATKDEVLRRDRDDSTVNNFMTAANGVTAIDSSDLTIDEVVQAVISLIPEDMR